MCSELNVYMFVYTLIGAQIVPSMFKAVILMQLRVMMCIDSKKSAVFVLVNCTYKQSLNELQQPDLTGRLWN